MWQSALFLHARPWRWFVVGAVLLVAAQLRFGVGVLAWVAPVPFLRALRVTPGWRRRAAFWGWILLAWNLAVVTITGLHGVSFLAALTAVALEGLREGRRTARVRVGAIALVLVAVAWVLGEARLVMVDGRANDTVRVAGRAKRHRREAPVLRRGRAQCRVRLRCPPPCRNGRCPLAGGLCPRRGPQRAVRAAERLASEAFRAIDDLRAHRETVGGSERVHPAFKRWTGVTPGQWVRT